MSRRSGGVVNVVERSLEHSLDLVWARFTHRPLAGATIAAGIGLALATTFGAAELALAAGVGYAAHRVLKRHEPPSQAIAEAFELERKLTG